MPVFAFPVVNDNLVVKEIATGLSSPTTIDFFGNDILVLEKTTGKVRLIRDGILQTNPVLDVNVTNSGERGMLGITKVGTTVYLYFTESTVDGGLPIANRIYSYTWNGNMLTNQMLVKELSANSGGHHGGVMTTGLDNAVYAVIGDLGRNGVLQNSGSGSPDDTSVILRVVPTGPYYAMGIRNSFGLAIDPFTGNLWDTENGPTSFDEINLVPPYFNSGWRVIMGPANASQISTLPGFENYTYSNPEFSWENTVAPTGLSFVNSKFFTQYRDDLFVGDCNNGNLYKFHLNSTRTGFVFTDSTLTDKVVNSGESMQEIIFGTGFGCISDVTVGPDGLLYVVSVSDGKIYQITPVFCTPPSSNDWIVNTSCTLENNFNAPANVIINNGSVLTIPDGLTLNVDFSHYHLLVKNGGGVLIKDGGSIN